VDFDREGRHQRAASRRRISAQGMVFTVVDAAVEAVEQ
jgi:hypothetical protein